MAPGGNVTAVTQNRRPSGWWYPWLFVGAFAVVIAVNGVMIALAIDSFTGLDTAHPYERGLDYNQTLAAARAQEEMGWQVTFNAMPDGSVTVDAHPIALEARFLDRDGRALTGLAVEALLVRPTAEGHDVEVALEDRGGGRYVAKAELPLPGQWDFRIVAHGRDTSWQSSRRIQLP